MKPLHSIVSLLLIASSGCAAESSSEAPASVEGDPALHGTVASASTRADSVDVAVLWDYYPPQGDPGVLVTERVTVDGAFPTSFKIGSLTPPPEKVLAGSATVEEPGHAQPGPTQTRVATGYVVLLRSGADIPETSFEDILGTCRKYSIAYVESDIVAGSNAEYRLGRLEAGFHLIDSSGGSPDCDVDDDAAWYTWADGSASCQKKLPSAPDGFATDLVVEGLASIAGGDGSPHDVPLVPEW